MDDITIYLLIGQAVLTVWLALLTYWQFTDTKHTDRCITILMHMINDLREELGHERTDTP